MLILYQNTAMAFEHTMSKSTSFIKMTHNLLHKTEVISQTEFLELCLKKSGKRSTPRLITHTLRYFGNSYFFLTFSCTLQDHRLYRKKKAMVWSSLNIHWLRPSWMNLVLFLSIDLAAGKLSTSYGGL